MPITKPRTSSPTTARKRIAAGAAALTLLVPSAIALAGPAAAGGNHDKTINTAQTSINGQPNLKVSCDVDAVFRANFENKAPKPTGNFTVTLPSVPLSQTGPAAHDGKRYYFSANLGKLPVGQWHYDLTYSGPESFKDTSANKTIKVEGTSSVVAATVSSVIAGPAGTTVTFTSTHTGTFDATVTGPGGYSTTITFAGGTATLSLPAGAAAGTYTVAPEAKDQCISFKGTSFELVKDSGTEGGADGTTDGGTTDGGTTDGGTTDGGTTDGGTSAGGSDGETDGTTDGGTTDGTTDGGTTDGETDGTTAGGTDGGGTEGTTDGATDGEATEGTDSDGGTTDGEATDGESTDGQSTNGQSSGELSNEVVADDEKSDELASTGLELVVPGIAALGLLAGGAYLVRRRVA